MITMTHQGRTKLCGWVRSSTCSRRVTIIVRCCFVRLVCTADADIFLYFWYVFMHIHHFVSIVTCFKSTQQTDVRGCSEFGPANGCGCILQHIMPYFVTSQSESKLSRSRVHSGNIWKLTTDTSRRSCNSLRSWNRTQSRTGRKVSKVCKRNSTRSLTNEGSGYMS